ncbi:heme biosynthesis HemY N-terminal domain-containing protein [Algibacillus agarilyticus]|uniref:heme biosynthesis HemY N-terminal domain-containing protein n=1 Tax=Algibacillus agarilyticus TaxID=2234133 RepID=UPI000DCFFCCB|nr:heme biosynthesis HemY N-terminal domain-containing protein [Algibacillus agarilyticus]
MIRFILFILFITGVLALGFYWVDEKGYVLIAMNEWTIETSVVASVIMLIGAYFAFHLSVRFIVAVFRLRSVSKAWRAQRRQKGAFIQFDKAFEAFLSGEYVTAEKLSLTQAEHSPVRKSHFLMAAESAKRQGKFDDHARYSLRAVEQGSDLEKQLVLVQNLKEQGELLQAIEQAEALYKKHPKQCQTLVLLSMLYKDANRSAHLVELLKPLKQHTDMPNEVYEGLVKSAFSGLFSELANAKQLKPLQQLADRLKKLSDAPEKLIYLYVNALNQAGFNDDAEKFVLKSAKNAITPEWVMMLKHAQFQQPLKLIAWLEQAIKKNPDDILAVTALAYVAASARDWTLAQKAFEMVIRKQPAQDEYFALAHVLEQSQQTSQALACYKKGVSLTR